MSCCGAFLGIAVNAGLSLGMHGLPNTFGAFSVGQEESHTFQDGWQGRQAASPAHFANSA